MPDDITVLVAAITANLPGRFPIDIALWEISDIAAYLYRYGRRRKERIYCNMEKMTPNAVLSGNPPLAKQPIRRWTKDEITVLAAAYSDTPTSVLAKSLGRSERSVYFQAFRLGLKKSAAYFASEHSSKFKPGTNNGNRFKPGQKPWNAGMNGYQAGGRSAETRFKVGRKPEEARNYRPIGSVRLTKDGYCERKVTDNQDVYPARRWVPVHRLVWEEVHGPVKKGMIVVFKPGMHTQYPDEITIDRLELITRQENMQHNTVHRLPKEIVQLVKLRSALVRKINERAKE